MQTPAPLLAFLALCASVTAFFPMPWQGEADSARHELAKRGVDLGPAALVAAMENEDRGTARLLLRAGLDPEIRDEKGRSLLMLAVGSGMPDVAEELIEMGVSLHATDHNGVSVLEYAMRAGEVSIVAALLDREINPDTKVPGGGKMVAEAVKAGRTASAKLLLESGASKWSKCSDKGPLIFHATRLGADWFVERLLERGVNANMIDEHGDSLVHTLVRSDRSHLLRLLWKHGIDPDARNREGETALHVAVLRGRVDFVRSLLKHGASAGSRHPTGWKPLHLALQRGDTGSMQILLAHGANPDEAGAGGRTAMDEVMALKPPREHLALLLEAGADPNTKGPDGRTPFDVMLTRRDFASAQLLLDHGAETGRTLLNAVVEDDEETFDFLLKADADPNGSWSDSPLVAAVRNGNVSMVARLLKAEADPERKGKEGQPALHLAVAMDRVDLAKLLLEAGADANVPFADPASSAFLGKVRKVGYIHWQFRKDSRITPLMMAADSGNHAMARALLDHGARKQVRTKRKAYYPVGFAARRDDVKMMQLVLDRDPEKEDRWIKVDLSQQRAHVYGKDGGTIFSTRISSGKEGFRTKTGEFVITNKTRNHTSTIYDDAEMPYFQRLSCGDFGFHEGYCPGHAASHGCIRVPPGNALKLWNLTEPGDRVVIQP